MQARCVAESDCLHLLHAGLRAGGVCDWSDVQVNSLLEECECCGDVFPLMTMTVSEVGQVLCQKCKDQRHLRLCPGCGMQSVETIGTELKEQIPLTVGEPFSKQI